MPRDVSWKQEIALAVGQDTLTKDIDDVKVRGVYAGIVAPDFEATTLAGKPFRLAELRGKVVLLDFWATWCAPCVAELPNVRKLHDQYSRDGLVVVGISFDRNADAARAFVADEHLDWTQIFAEKADKSPLADIYGVSAIPATFLIGPDGKVIDRDLRGEQLRDATQRAVEKLKKSRHLTSMHEAP